MSHDVLSSMTTGSGPPSSSMHAAYMTVLLGLFGVLGPVTRFAVDFAESLAVACREREGWLREGRDVSGDLYSRSR